MIREQLSGHVQWRLPAVHRRTRQYARQAIAVVTVHVGNQDGFQCIQRQFGAQDLMLSALSTIDQIPALPLALAQRDPGDVSLLGGYTGGGAEEE